MPTTCNFCDSSKTRKYKNGTMYECKNCGHFGPVRKVKKTKAVSQTEKLGREFLGFR